MFNLKAMETWFFLSMHMMKFLKKFNMKKINKITNIGLMFMIIGVFLCQDSAYSLSFRNTMLRLQLGKWDDTLPRVEETMSRLVSNQTETDLRISIVEGHDVAYRYLPENCILINFDSHGDLGFEFKVVPDGSITYYDRQGNKLKLGDRIEMNEINWIGHAKLSGLVRKYIWVVPERYGGEDASSIVVENLSSFDKPVIITIDYDYFALDYFDPFDEKGDSSYLPTSAEISEEIAKIIKILMRQKIHCDRVILARSPGYAASGYIDDIEKELKAAFAGFFEWQDAKSLAQKNVATLREINSNL